MPHSPAVEIISNCGGRVFCHSAHTHKAWLQFFRRCPPFNLLYIFPYLSFVQVQLYHSLWVWLGGQLPHWASKGTEVQISPIHTTKQGSPVFSRLNQNTCRNNSRVWCSLFFPWRPLCCCFFFRGKPTKGPTGMKEKGEKKNCLCFCVPFFGGGISVPQIRRPLNPLGRKRPKRPTERQRAWSFFSTSEASKWARVLGLKPFTSKRRRD